MAGSKASGSQRPDINAGPGRAYTLHDLVVAFRKLTGRGPRIATMSSTAMRLSGWLARPLIGRLAPAGGRGVDTAGMALMRHDLHLDMSRAEGELGFRPRFDLEEGLALTLASLEQGS